MNYAPHSIESLLKKRILILDGAMGTMIQQYKLSEGYYRGIVAHGNYADARQDLVHHAHDLKGNNDLLVLTQPSHPVSSSPQPRMLPA